jgi:hypothetical protein
VWWKLRGDLWGAEWVGAVSEFDGCGCFVFVVGVVCFDFQRSVFKLVGIHILDTVDNFQLPVLESVSICIVTIKHSQLLVAVFQ